MRHLQSQVINFLIPSTPNITNFPKITIKAPKTLIQRGSKHLSYFWRDRTLGPNELQVPSVKSASSTFTPSIIHSSSLKPPFPKVKSLFAWEK